MAEKKEVMPFKLTPEQQAMMKGLGGDVELLRVQIKKVEDLDVDMTKIKEMVDYAEKMRTTLLKSFS